MKRILIFSLTYHPYIGGAEVAIKEITDRIDTKEFAFDMITLRFDRSLPKVEKVGNVTVYRIGFTADAPKVSDRALPFQIKVAKILFPVTSFLKALSLNWKHRYSMTWAMMANYAAFGALLFKYTHPRTPYFLELQDGNSLEEVKIRQPVLKFGWKFYEQIYFKAETIKAISRFIERLAREIGYKGHVEIIPNGVNTTKFSAPLSDDTLWDLKTRFDKKMGDVFLFTASRLVLSRGVEDVIQALQYLPRNVKLLIAGDGEDKEKLQAIARGLNVEERVLFAGHVDHAQLPAYYRISDIFVRPSIIEGFGNSFIEAFASGIPVVATRVGGIPDFLYDPEKNPAQEPTGVFCEVRDPRSVASAIERYLNDPTLTARVVRNAKSLALEKYDWNIIARDMHEKIFEKLAIG